MTSQEQILKKERRQSIPEGCPFCELFNHMLEWKILDARDWSLLLLHVQKEHDPVRKDDWRQAFV